MYRGFTPPTPPASRWINSSSTPITLLGQEPEILPAFSVLDPACGSGAFLVAAMKTLLNIYGPVVGKIKFSTSANLKKWLRQVEQDHPSIGYFIRKRIITDNLFGVDIMEEATEIARLRLFLAL